MTLDGNLTRDGSKNSRHIRLPRGPTFDYTTAHPYATSDRRAGVNIPPGRPGRGEDLATAPVLFTPSASGRQGFARPRCVSLNKESEVVDTHRRRWLPRTRPGRGGRSPSLKTLRNDRTFRRLGRRREPRPSRFPTS